MKNQKYKSYNQIEKDLEILRIEKEICYQRLIQIFQNTKKSLEPKNLLVSVVPKTVLSVLEVLTGSTKSIIISFILKKIFK